jgi:predicted nucleic acid-binding protein
MAERCVDASVALKWAIARAAWRKKARRFLQDSTAAGITLIAPPLFEYETESGLQTLLHMGLLTVAETDSALVQIAAVRVQLVTHPAMVRRARDIARRFNQPKIYDSLYAALAELRSCEFWTADKAFFDAVKATLTFIKYLPDYP